MQLRCGCALPASRMSASICCRRQPPTCASMGRASTRPLWWRRWRRVALEYRTQAEVAAYGVGSLVAYVVQQERAATWMPFSRPPYPARLKPYFGTEGANRFALLNDQRRFIRSWIGRQHVYALARREIANRRAAAFAAEGLA